MGYYPRATAEAKGDGPTSLQRPGCDGGHPVGLENRRTLAGPARRVPQPLDLLAKIATMEGGGRMGKALGEHP